VNPRRGGGRRKEGRNKLRKYGTHYAYLGDAPLAEGSGGGGGETDEHVALQYTPMYGNVPGYVPDSATGDAVRIGLKQDMGEWRVLRAEL
jgi:hypothetical protein